jgi:uncharacterized FlgJ-related protein
MITKQKLSELCEMLFDANFNIYELENKADIRGLKKARIKLRALKQLIDSSMIKIANEKTYIVTQEARTF